MSCDCVHKIISSLNTHLLSFYLLLLELPNHEQHMNRLSDYNEVRIWQTLFGVELQQAERIQSKQQID